MKVVKEARVKVVKVTDLEVGDHILYSNLMCKVLKLPLNYIHPMERVNRLTVQQFPDDPDSDMEIGPFRKYYKIEDAELIDACIPCGKEIPEERDDKNTCRKCYTEQIMGSSVNPENGEPWTEEEIRDELNMLRETEKGACDDRF